MITIFKHKKDIPQEFADTYGLCLPNDVLFDASLLFGLF